MDENTSPQDRVLLGTRALALLVLPFLVAATAILYIWPDRTGELFAWTIKPTMTAMMLGAAYAGGIYFFARVARAQTWHSIKLGLLPVVAFAGSLGVATLLHWDRFNHQHISFYAWAGLYFTTPFLVLAVWLRNRSEDPRGVAHDDAVLPAAFRWFAAVVGTTTVAVAVALFLSPQLMIERWPWALTPLTARVVGAMFALPGVVGLCISAEPRWSAAKIILEAQALGIALILVAVVRDWTDFNQRGLLAWLFVLGLAGLLASIAALYLVMRARVARLTRSAL